MQLSSQRTKKEKNGVIVIYNDQSDSITHVLKDTPVVCLPISRKKPLIDELLSQQHDFNDFTSEVRR